MKSTSNAPIYMKVYNRLKNQILSGSYPSGSFLPTESELEQIYQVSRTTIRKAVKMLSDEGIFKCTAGLRHHGHGYTVPHKTTTR